MKLKIMWFRTYYNKLFNFIASPRLKKGDIDPREIHVQMAVVLSTGVLMWAYAILAYFTISSPIPGVIGFICAAVHLLSPLLFRFTNNSYLVANVLLTAGIVHQSSFTYFSGGFESNILIWFGILPLLGGVISGKASAVTWMCLTLFVSLIYFGLQMNGYPFPYLISDAGRLWSQGLLVFGWILISSAVVIVYIGLSQNTEMRLKEQGQKIDDLFRVLFHDLANPLGRISIGLSIAKKKLPPGESNRGIEIASLASDSMIEITQNIRKMYAISKGKANVDLTLISLNSALEYILKIYSADLERKEIKFEYDFEKNVGLVLLVEPISFNNQVLGNIISNAIKFSKVGSTIHLTAYPLTKNTFKVEIQDQGIGIPKGIIEHLFDLNKKTTRVGTEGETGTGFGMHILKSFVEMYGGEVAVESAEPQDHTPSGTKVILTLKGEWN